MYFKCFSASKVVYAVLLGGLLLNNPLQANAFAVTDAQSKIERPSYRKPPKIEFDNADLKGQDRHASIRIGIDEQGKVSDVSMVRSTGLPGMDAKVIAAFKLVEFTPYIENGEGIPVYTVVQLRFDLLH